MLIDIHMHTSRYSACGKASAEAMMAVALDRGLDGVTITEHNAVWRDDELAELRAAYSALRIFRGIELNTAEDEDLLVYGVPEPEALTGRLPVATVIERAHAVGGAVVLAHPLRYRDTIAADLYTTPPDACEAWSTNIYAFQRPGIRAFQQEIGAGLTAASDAHVTDALGSYALQFQQEIGDENELADAIRRRAYTPHFDKSLLSEMEAQLSERVGHVRAALAEGLDSQTIYEQFRYPHSLTNHVKAGRRPSYLHECEAEVKQA